MKSWKINEKERDGPFFLLKDRNTEWESSRLIQFETHKKGFQTWMNFLAATLKFEKWSYNFYLFFLFLVLVAAAVARMPREVWAVWPDWAILGDKFSYKRSPNVCWLVGLFWKHPFSLINWCSYFLGNFWKFLGYFIFQRLVTLGMRLKQIVCQQRFVWCPGLFERDSSQSYIK